MRGDSPEEVAALLMAQPGLQGLQGPTISPVYGPGEFIAADIMVPVKLRQSPAAFRCSCCCPAVPDARCLCSIYQQPACLAGRDT